MAQVNEANSLFFALASFCCGIFLLERGADNFVDSTAIVAKRLGVSPTLIGLLTCGAEWEELVVIAVALSQGQYSMALGNLMGSSIANVLGSFSLGLVCAQRVMAFDRSSKIYSTALLSLVSVFLIGLYVVPAKAGWLAARDAHRDGAEGNEKDVTPSEQELQGQIRSSGGWGEDERGLLSANARSSDKRQKAGRRPYKPLRRHVMKLLFGFIALVVSGYVLAQSARIIGDQLGLSGTVTGTTILSLATTLPEKFVAVLAGSRHQHGILVANTVGSNIFLVTLCGGVLFIWAGAGDDGEMKAMFSLSEALMMWISAAALFLVVIVGALPPVDAAVPVYTA
ncbi:Sodium/calcium exchanger MaX1 [Cytospora mali]|uniref:Sodium/calcium exchanger MaX1 n=1 Tax=Cytospora mali TaxID=578113 RepID=A0A194WCM8_CYTMA|nr:Sodium/calcium exchanger MaX1 [Valsa mali]